MAMTKDQRESFLDDVQILRNRCISPDKIAEILGVDRRQVWRWVLILKRQHRWRTFIRESQPSDYIHQKDENGKWVN